MINWKLERSIEFSLDVQVMPLANPNLVSKKRMCVVDLDFVSDSQQALKCLAKEAKIQDLTP